MSFSHGNKKNNLDKTFPTDKNKFASTNDNKYFVRISTRGMEMKPLMTSTGKAADGDDQYFEGKNIERKIWAKINQHEYFPRGLELDGFAILRKKTTPLIVYMKS